MNPQQNHPNIETIIKAPNLIPKPMPGQMPPGMPMMPNFLNPANMGGPPGMIPNQGMPIPNFMNMNNQMNHLMKPPQIAGMNQPINPVNTPIIVQQQQPAVIEQPQKSSGEQWKKLWVGNIPEELPDEDITKLLSFCGEITNWKRTSGATFGFVEFSQVETVLKCIRLITDFEISQDHYLKVKPSEKTQMFLNQWKDLKTKEWQMKKPEETLKFKNFDEYLQKDDESFSTNIKELMEEIDVKLAARRKERMKDEEKKEHPRERERDQDKKHAKRTKERKAEEEIEQQIRLEESKRKYKKREKEKDRDSQLFVKKLIEKELNMDSDEEKRFFSKTYKQSQRKKFRQKEFEEDEADKLKEQQAPPTADYVKSLIPKHTEEMEEEHYQHQNNKPYQHSFQVQEITINPERQQQITIEQSHQTTNNNGTNGNGHIQQQQQSSFQQQQQLQRQVQGFENEDEEDDNGKNEMERKKLNIALPGIKKPQAATAPAQSQQVQDKQQQADIQLKLQLQQIIKCIPKEKKEIFAFQINWTALAKSDILEKKVKPWLIQKSEEYLSQAEMNFVKMIIKKLINAETPEMILKKVEIILEEDAEEFVVKLWRMLIFELLKLEKGISS